MKKPALFLTLLLLCSLACKDKKDKSCDANFLEADVNNVLWRPTEVASFNSGPTGNITIEAKASFGVVTSMVIQVSGSVKEGTYPLQQNLFTQSIIVSPGGFQADNGELTITVHDTEAQIIKGTFFFSIPSEGLTVEAGSFCVNY